jgi:hypothetical protein
MKKAIKPLILALAIVAAGGALMIKQKNRLGQEPLSDVTPVVVGEQSVSDRQVNLTLATVADVMAVRDMVLASRLTAYVTHLSLFEGDHFKRGQLLVRMDMRQAGAGFPPENSLTADLAASATTFKAESESLSRSRGLYKIGGVSLEQLQLAEASAAAARAHLTEARENLANTALTAPFDGAVSERYVQSGDLVTPGKPLLKIVDLDAGMRLVVSAPNGMSPAGLLVDGQSLPLKPWPEASKDGTRRFEARIAGHDLAPGSRTPVKTIIYSGQGILIPRGCTLNSDGHGAEILKLQDKKASVLSVASIAEGEEGIVTRDMRAIGRIACASPDILARLAAGVPFQIGK